MFLIKKVDRSERTNEGEEKSMGDRSRDFPIKILSSDTMNKGTSTSVVQSRPERLRLTQTYFL